MAEDVGRLVARRYRLRQSLGRGGMGVVWLAHDEFLDREVAVKQIRPGGRELRDEDPEVRRALREARAAAKLSKHPGIITVHDVVTDEHGLPWIVMELLTGRPLSELLETDGPLSVARAARIGTQVLSALDYAHTNGVLHRDVKAGNVILVEDQAVLTDFGIAVIDGESVLTATGQLPGVPEYISPERIRGEEASPAADLWSVGIMLYGMVVGRTPFARGDVSATLGAVLSWEPDPDPKVGRLAPVIEGLLRKRPAERMSAATAIEKLTEVVALPASAPPGVRVRLEYPTRSDNPAGDLTVADATVPSTRTELPAFLPWAANRTEVRPDAPTVDPRPLSPPARPRSRRAPVVLASAVVLVVAVVVTVVLTSQTGGERGTASATTTTTVGTSTVATLPPDLTLQTQEEELGFEIDVPLGWERKRSVDGEIDSVTWTGEPIDGAPFTVYVQRRPGSPTDSALTILAEEHEDRPTEEGVSDYDSTGPSGSESTAELKYEYRLRGYHYHVRIRVVVADDAVFQLGISTYAKDATTLANNWAATESLVDEIVDSFRLSAT